MPSTGKIFSAAIHKIQEENVALRTLILELRNDLKTNISIDHYKKLCKENNLDDLTLKLKG